MVGQWKIEGRQNNTENSSLEVCDQRAGKEGGREEYPQPSSRPPLLVPAHCVVITAVCSLFLQRGRRKQADAMGKWEIIHKEINQPPRVSSYPTGGKSSDLCVFLDEYNISGPFKGGFPLENTVVSSPGMLEPACCISRTFPPSETSVIAL